MSYVVKFYTNFVSKTSHSFNSLSYDRSKASSKRAVHIVRFRASSFKWEYPLLSLMSSSRFLRLLLRLPVPSIPPFIFPSITRCRRQFLRKMWPIHLVIRLLISCRIFLCSLTLCNSSSFLTRSVQLIFSILLQHHISKLSRCFRFTARSAQASAPYKAMLEMQHFTSFFLNFKSNMLVKRALFLLNAALVTAILQLISQVHLPSFVNMLLQYLKHPTISSCFQSNNNLPRYFQNVYRPKWPNFNKILISSTDFSKITQMSNFIRMRPEKAELFHLDRWTDITKLKVTFRNIFKRA